MTDNNSLPENRRKKLKQLLLAKPYVRVLEASDGLSGMLVEHTAVDGKTYDAIWVSSFCDSIKKGMPDNEIVDFTNRCMTIEQILSVTTKPLIVDGDTGGKTQHFVQHVRKLECIGVSAVVIEDKTGLKYNSLQTEKAEHILEEPEVFAEKIKCGKKAQQTNEFMIFARIESLIAKRPLEEALARAQMYVKAGADGIMIHSKKKDGVEVKAFLEAFRQQYPDVPVMVVPTAYCSVSEQELCGWGANIIVYANQLLRSAFSAMQKAAQTILKNERALEVTEQCCASMEELLLFIERQQEEE